jgi:hypothetical protein
MSTSLKQASNETMPECNLKQACKDAIGMQIGRRRKTRQDKRKRREGKKELRKG